MIIFAVILAVVLYNGFTDESYPALDTHTLPSDHFRVIVMPRNVVLDVSISRLGNKSFVIDNPGKSSGLLSVSYSGDPEKFIDCGHVTSHVKDAGGQRDYDFPGAKAQMTYDIMNGNTLLHIDRKMSVTAHVSLAFREINPNQTKVTANTLYVVRKDVTSTNADTDFHQSWSDSVSFTTRGAAPFGNEINSAATTSCVATGELEREVLTAIE